MNNSKSPNDSDHGDWMYQLACELFPITRSITGDGVRKTLGILRRELPELEIMEVSSGTPCFDWTVPPEWNIREAYIVGPDGHKFADFRENNLHVMGYSEPVHKKLSLEELNSHLHSLPEQPHAIPYVTSFYKRAWGFCLADDERRQLQPGDYEVVIDSTLDMNGHLTYAELVIPATVDGAREVYLSTYICHPSMANNEISGPVVTTCLARWLRELSERRHTYRIIFVPETIGAIVYLSRMFEHLSASVIAGFNISCVGDDRTYSFLPSRNGKSISDDVAKHVLGYLVDDFDTYSFLDRGSDERQYNAPGIDLPVAAVMRSKFGTYPEYHTSDDNLDFISPKGLQGGYTALQHCLMSLEENRFFKATVLGEPHLAKYDLYPPSRKKGDWKPKDLLNILAYADGKTSLLEIANILDQPIWELAKSAKTLLDISLLQDVSGSTSDET